MATVPTYTPSVAERPRFQQSITVQASGEDMGAAIGRGLQGVGQGMQQAGRAAFELQQLENQARAKEADDQFAAWIRERQYGEGGYMTLSGRAAVEGREAFERELAEKRMSFGENLQPGAATMYQGASMARLNSTVNSAVVHQAQERKVWMNDSANARKETFKSDALANWNVPAAVDRNIAAGQMELREQAALMGWDADRLAREEQLYISGVRHDVALRIAADDPIAAKAYIDEHRDQLTGEHQFKLDEALEVPLATAQGEQAAAAFFDAHPGRAEAVENTGQGPTRAKAYLLEHSVNPRASHIDGLDGAFANNLAAMMQDAPFDGLGVLSGNRTVEEQRVLWEAELARQGGNEAAARRNVAPPGKSNHNHGQAVDLSYNGKSLKHAPPEVIEWVHANAGKYGLTFPMSWENWHIEPVSARGATAVPATGVTTQRAQMPSWTEVEDYLAGISDPKAREVARSMITSRMNAAAKDEETSRKAVVETAFSEMMTQNVSPYSFSPEVQSMIGREGMSNLMTYWDKVSSGEKIETDPQLLYAMSNAYATDPAKFAEVDLTPYFDRLSDADRDKVMGWQQTALTNQRLAYEEGGTLKTAMDMAKVHLNAAGIKTGSSDAKDASREAQFQIALQQEIAAMQEANEGRALSTPEIQQLINRMLLPVVIRSPNDAAMPGLIPDPFASFGRLFGGVEQRGLMFEAGARPDGSTVEVDLAYDDVPTDMRTAIRSSLEAELGRTPTEGEIVDEYERFLLGE